MTCIPSTEEKYISFSKRIKVDEYKSRKSGETVSLNFEIRFIDSFKFLQTSFANLVSNLQPKDFKNTKAIIKNNVGLLTRVTILIKNLIACHMIKTEVYFNKPMYVGQEILHLSKTLMFDFHYNYIKSKYGNKAELLFTDTDSLMYGIETDDFYQDIAKDAKRKFDTTPQIP